MTASLFKITVQHVHAHEKEYGYHLQLSVGVVQQHREGQGRRSDAPVFVPFALWNSDPNNTATLAATSPPPEWWNTETCSMSVPPKSAIEWDIGDKNRIGEHVEVSLAEQTIEFQLCKVKMMAAEEEGSVSSKKKKRATVTYGNKIVLGNTADNDGVTVTLAFGETATATILVHRLSAADVAALQATRGLTATDRSAPILTLVDAAAAMSARATRTLEGSRAHRLLSEWSGALEAVGGQLAPLLSTLPFGDLLATAVAGLFAAVMGRGAVLELGADLCGQTVLVLRVLVQPPVREMIITDPSTHSLLEQLLVAMEDTVRILEEYNASWTVAQLWKAGSRLDKLQQQSAEMHRIFTLMFQLTSFRAQGSQANDMHRVLEAVGAMQLLTTDRLCEHLLPQLLDRLDSVAVNTENAVRNAQASSTAALGEMFTVLLQDITSMTTTELDERFTALQTSSNDAVAAAACSVKDDIRSITSTVVSAASKTTVSTLSNTMRSLLDDVMRNVLPSMMNSAVSSGLKEHLETVASDAWVSELQRGMKDAASLVQAHTTRTVSVATIQLGAQVLTLQQRLEHASTATDDAMRSMEATLQQTIQVRIDSAQDVVRDEARAVRTEIDRAHLSLAEKIAVVHMEVTGLFGELHLQRRVLKDIDTKLDCMYESGGAVLRKQTEITEVLDALPESVRQALSRDVLTTSQASRAAPTTPEPPVPHTRFCEAFVDGCNVAADEVVHGAPSIATAAGSGNKTVLVRSITGAEGNPAAADPRSG